MATRAILHPYAAEPPDSGAGSITRVNERPVIEYATSQDMYWTLPAPAGLTGTLTVDCYCMMASATSGNVVLRAAVAAVTAADATDLDATTSFDTTNTSSATAVPGTAGYLFKVTVTLSSNDAMAAGDYVRLKVGRHSTGDTATGNLRLLFAEFKDAA